MSATPTQPQIASASPMPQGVTDPNYKPLPGRLGNLSVVQQHTLEKFKKELIEDGVFVEERMDDATLLRWEPNVPCSVLLYPFLLALLWIDFCGRGSLTLPKPRQC